MKVPYCTSLFSVTLMICLSALMSHRILAEEARTQWELVWADEFEGKAINTNFWSKIPRGKSDWNRHMSFDDSLFAVKDGHLVLWGKVNPSGSDPVPYITGGVYTKDKVTTLYGKVEIRAKLYGAKGAWPAFWMLPNEGKWPDGGEIDIMERLSFDAIAYQTIHSHYTYTLKIATPKHGSKGPINPDDFNVYALEWYPNMLVLSINGVPTLRYPKIETDKQGQWPFTTPFYVLLDMQLGGKWVGEVEPRDLPVKMEIDWIRIYKQAGGPQPVKN